MSFSCFESWPYSHIQSCFLALSLLSSTYQILFPNWRNVCSNTCTVHRVVLATACGCLFYYFSAKNEVLFAAWHNIFGRLLISEKDKPSLCTLMEMKILTLPKLECCFHASLYKSYKKEKSPKGRDQQKTKKNTKRRFNMKALLKNIVIQPYPFMCKIM